MAKRPWNICRRDNITYRNRKMKVRQFVRIVESDLPVMYFKEVQVDHREKIKDGYVNSGLQGIADYEKSVWDKYNQCIVNDDLETLSVRTKRAVTIALDKELLNVTMEDLIALKPEDISKVRGMGKTTLEELEPIFKKYVK